MDQPPEPIEVPEVSEVPEAVEAPEATRVAVPRPPGARPGAPAPWSALPAADRREIRLDRVRRAVHGVARAAGVSPPPLDPRGARRSAVLVALFEEEGETRVVLTRRSSRLRHHRGEVSFPGGRMEPGELPADAAVREAYEEVGLDPVRVETGEELSPLKTFSSGSFIVPVIGLLGDRPLLAANPGEVARVFDVGLAELAADGVFHEELWPSSSRAIAGSSDGWFPVWFFDISDETVWGATARILTELLCMVLGTGPQS